MLERGRKRFLDGPSLVRTVLRRCSPSQVILVGEPGAESFRLPIAVERDGVARAALRAVIRGDAMSAAVLLLMGLPVLALAAWYLSFESEGFWIALIIVVGGMLLAWDARLQTLHRELLHERATFFYWLHEHSRARLGGGICLGLLILMSGLQWWVMRPGDDPTPAFDSYGLLYARVAEGEAWRLLTGPYLHYSVPHFLLSGFLFVHLGGLVWAYRGGLTLLIFAAVCSVSLTAQILFGRDVHESTGGNSGGVYALAGLVLAGTLTPSGRLPRGFASQLLAIVLLSILLAELVSGSAPTVANVSGLGVGFLIGVVLSFPRRN